MVKKSTNTMTLTDFARKWGVDYSTAKRWRTDGLVVPAHGPVDVLKSEKRLAERPSYNRGGKVKGPGAEEGETPAGSFADAKRTRATFEALLAEHRHARLVESLAPVAAAIDAVAEDQAIVRERLRQTPAWVASRLVNVDTAPLAAAILQKVFAGALHDLSKEEHEAPWDGNLAGAPLPDAKTQIYYIDSDGEVHYSRRPKEVEPPLAEPKKPRRRRRSTPAVEAAIAEAGAEDEVDQDLIYAVERAVPTMSLTEARTRREVAEGGLKRAQYDELKKRVVHVDKVKAALTANLNGIKTNVLAIASKVAPRVAMLVGSKEIQKVISKELELVLADMAEPKTLVNGCMNDED